jgi:hypothetical protein
VASLKADRNRAVEALDYTKKSSANPIEIDPVVIDRFARLMREQLLSGDVAHPRRLRGRPCGPCTGAARKQGISGKPTKICDHRLDHHVERPCFSGDFDSRQPHHVGHGTA